MDDAPALKTRTCPVTGGPRPYHHGDLRRALIEAAERVLEREGAQALSLRAVAREAGVSPAAPYHHFKDKSDLLNALAGEGFDRLTASLKAAFGDKEGGGLVSIGPAYVQFARNNPALYRVMYDSARNLEAMPDHEKIGKDDGGMGVVKQAMVLAGANPDDEMGLELACIAAWCAAHGVAEMAGFTQFKPLIERLGGEDAFIRAVFAALGYRKAFSGG